MRVRRRGQVGFSLIEVLVALAIMTLAFSGLYTSIGDQYRYAQRTRAYDTALAFGRSQLERVGADIALGAGQTGGRISADMVWSLTMVPLSDMGTVPDGRYRSYSVTFEAMDGRERSLLTLRTLRVGRLPS